MSQYAQGWSYARYLRQTRLSEQQANIAGMCACALIAWLLIGSAMRTCGDMPLPPPRPAVVTSGGPMRRRLRGLAGGLWRRARKAAGPVMRALRQRVGEVSDDSGFNQALAEAYRERDQARERATFLDGELLRIQAARVAAEGLCATHEGEIADLSRQIDHARALMSRPDGNAPFLVEGVAALRKALGEAEHTILALRSLKDDALQEAERRYDCHSGPGTTLPACNACVSCLMRKIGGLEADIADREREDAEARVVSDATDAALAEEDPRCELCRKPATCLGKYDGMETPELHCDDCCGHGCEDGWCILLGLAKVRQERDALLAKAEGSGWVGSGGKPLTIDQQAWADALATVTQERDALRAKLLLHPCGACTCAGEGECAWCQITAAKERAEEAEAAANEARSKQAVAEAILRDAMERHGKYRHVQDSGQTCECATCSLRRAARAYFAGQPPAPLSATAFWDYCRILHRLLSLDNECDEADVLRDQMDAPWRLLTKEQVDIAGAFAGWRTRADSAEEHVHIFRDLLAGHRRNDETSEMALQRLIRERGEAIRDAEEDRQIAARKHAAVLETRDERDAALTRADDAEERCRQHVACSDRQALEYDALARRYEQIEAERNHLLGLVKDAPHGSSCARLNKIDGYARGTECTCWKSRALAQRDDTQCSGCATWKAWRIAEDRRLAEALAGDSDDDGRGWMWERAAKVLDARKAAQGPAGVTGILRRAATPRTSPPDGLSLICAERRRQMDAEGWTPEHDDDHDKGELAWAAICYAAPAEVRAQVEVPLSSVCGCREAMCPHVGFATKKVWGDPWPWGAESDKRNKHPRLRRLAIAGALIAAEIDRELRGGGPPKESAHADSRTEPDSAAGSTSETTATAGQAATDSTGPAEAKTAASGVQSDQIVPDQSVDWPAIRRHLWGWWQVNLSSPIVATPSWRDLTTACAPNTQDISALRRSLKSVEQAARDAGVWWKREPEFAEPREPLSTDLRDVILAVGKLSGCTCPPGWSGHIEGCLAIEPRSAVWSKPIKREPDEVDGIVDALDRGLTGHEAPTVALPSVMPFSSAYALQIPVAIDWPAIQGALDIFWGTPEAAANPIYQPFLVAVLAAERRDLPAFIKAIADVEQIAKHGHGQQRLWDRQPEPRLCALPETNPDAYLTPLARSVLACKDLLPPIGS